tara:strand:+ start:1608 stop:1979 length:372 start_codon:yes stop_codon:yes gene_type:complete
MNLYKTIKEITARQLYEAEAVMDSDRDVNLTLVTDALRGICGITTAKVIGSAKPISATRERTFLKIKFFLLEASLEQHIKRMVFEAKRLKMNLPQKDKAVSSIASPIREFRIKRVAPVRDRIY